MTDAATGITVTGVGSAGAPADLVRVSLEASVVRPGVGEAVAACEETARGLRAALATHGVGGADAATSTLVVRPEEVWDNGRRSLDGYRAQHGILAVVRDVSGLGAVLGAALGAGGDDVRLQEVSFAVADEAALRSRARAAAWDDALTRGTELARLAGRTLGSVEDLLETEDGAAPSPRPAKAAMYRGGDPEVAPQPGLVEVTVGLRVRWSLG